MRNAKYSLRAFARDLDVAPSRIVEVLNYKRGLSRLSAKKMADRMGFESTETEIFLNLVDSVHGRSQLVRTRALRELAMARSKDFTSLQVDAFKLISDWHHYAILELTMLADFESDEDWIARRLGLPIAVIGPSIERLKRLGLLIEEDGRILATDDSTWSTSGIPSEGLKKHHEQILEKAQRAIYLQTLEQRDFSALTMAVSRADLPRAKELLKKMRRQIAAELTAHRKF